MKEPDQHGSPFLFARLTLFAAIIAAVLLVTATRACAAGFPQEVGAFTRSDGGRVTAFRIDDGSVMYLHTRCWFVMPNGSTVYVREPDRKRRMYRGCVVRSQDSAAEVYLYEHNDWPVAWLVQQFDGYKFVDVTTPRKRWLSPFVYISDYWIGYAIYGAFLLLLVIFGARHVRKMRKNGWGLVSRILSISFGVFIVGFFTLSPSAFGPHSPGVQLLFVTVEIMLYLTARKAIARYRPAS